MHCLSSSLSLFLQKLFTLLLYARISRSFFNSFNLSLDSSQSRLITREIYFFLRTRELCATLKHFNRREKWNKKKKWSSMTLNRTWWRIFHLYGWSSFFLFLEGRRFDNKKYHGEICSRGLEQHEGGWWTEGMRMATEGMVVGHQWKATNIPWNV